MRTPSKRMRRGGRKQELESPGSAHSTTRAVLGLLTSLRSKKPSGDFSFSADEPKLHAAFLRVRDRFPELLPNLTFDMRGLYPHSEELENILNVTQLAGSLERSNPSGTRYRLTSQGARLGESILTAPESLEADKRTIAKAVRILERELGHST